jgi:hypothetical protein
MLHPAELRALAGTCGTSTYTSAAAQRDGGPLRPTSPSYAAAAAARRRRSAGGRAAMGGPHPADIWHGGGGGHRPEQAPCDRSGAGGGGAVAGRPQRGIGTGDAAAGVG